MSIVATFVKTDSALGKAKNPAQVLPVSQARPERRRGTHARDQSSQDGQPHHMDGETEVQEKGIWHPGLLPPNLCLLLRGTNRPPKG